MSDRRDENSHPYSFRVTSVVGSYSFRVRISWPGRITLLGPRAFQR